MRLDQYLEQRGFVASPVDRFAEFQAEVEMPEDWELFDSTVGARVWIWRRNPRIDQFGANAVLTMHRLDVPLKATPVFHMLSEQQLQSVPDTHEIHRDVVAATEGPGVTGSLVLQMPSQFGAIESASTIRIITTERETLISQLTVSALHGLPLDRAHIRLTVSKREAVDSTPSAQHSRPPATDTETAADGR